MKSIEKGMQMPQDICFEKNNETRLLIMRIYQLEFYFRFMRNSKRLKDKLSNNYLKILN